LEFAQVPLEKVNFSSRSQDSDPLSSSRLVFPSSPSHSLHISNFQISIWL